MSNLLKINLLIKELKSLIFLLKYFFWNLREKNLGYNSFDLNNSIVSKTNVFVKNKKIIKNKNFLRTKKFINFLKKNHLNNIIDFGGSAGYHFFVAKKINKSLNFKWIVIENNTMVNMANKKIKIKGLSFYNKIKDINSPDVVFSSCAINYTADPVKIINKLIKLEPKYFYFTRTPLSKKKDYKFDQYSSLSDNGPCKISYEKNKIIKYKNYILNINKFESLFKNKKYILINKYIDEKNAFYSKFKFFDNYTYIFKRSKF